MTHAFEGLVAGYGIAIPVGAIALLIIELGVTAGFRPAAAAGAGAATADLVYAAIAAGAGAAATRFLAPADDLVRIVGATALFVIAALGFARAIRTPARARQRATHWPGHTYATFLGLTMLNPQTMVYFSALILGNAGDRLATNAARVAFVAGAFAASLSWQLTLAAGAALAHGRLSPRLRVATIVGGNLIVLALALRLITGR